MILLVDFSLLQLLTGLTLSDPHLSIILHVIREILHHHPLIFAKILQLFSKMCNFFQDVQCSSEIKLEYICAMLSDV